MASNIQIDETDEAIIVTMQKGVSLRKSSSGKSILVASTEGNMTLSSGLVLGLNLYRPVKS